MMLAIAAILFAAFVTDVVMGAMSGATILSDVQQMLLLFAASIAFVAAVLKRESKSKE